MMGGGQRWNRADTRAQLPVSWETTLLLGSDR
jgi:hypothetical protein